MLKELLTLGLVLVFGFIVWGAFEWSRWPIDYGQYQAEAVKLGPLDNTFEQHIIPKYFENAQIITNADSLKYP
jgi:hypothetical protein